MAQALLPTARTIRWWPVAAVVTALTGLLLLARSAGRPTDVVLLLGAAALASTVVGALRDEAGGALQAVPVSVMRRRVLRLGLVGGPVLLVWWALVTLGTSAGPATGSLLALAACGTAVAVWAPDRWAVLAGAAVPVLWFALDRVAGQGVAGDLLGWWRTAPWPVLALALACCAAGSRR
jgi:hypothetical protein